MNTANAIYLTVGGQQVALDLDGETELLPTFQANDRTKPESIQSDYSPEFSVPGTAHNHRLLGHAAASQPAQGSAYVRVPCMLTSGGVETMPLGLLYLKGYSEGRYKLQLVGGNRRLIEALSDKTLADLDLNRFNHFWNPANVAAGLPYAHWQAQGWGYEVYERGKVLDYQALNPYDLYPSCSANLVWTQILTDAGFTADDLTTEPLFAALNVPTANPYTFPESFRRPRRLQAGFAYNPVEASDSISDLRKIGLGHEGEFAPEKLTLGYTSVAPYHAPTGATYLAGVYMADTLGYYDLAGSVTLRFGCRPEFPGQVSCKVLLRVNGQPVLDVGGAELGKDELRIGNYQTHTFAPKLSRYLLHPGDTVELWWQGDEWPSGVFSPTDPYWQLGPLGTQTNLASGLRLANEVQFSVTLLEEFPPGGLVRLQDWLPDMKQLDFVKAVMLLLGLTIQADAYEPHLHLAPGSRLLANVPKARDWTAKRDAYAQPGRLPERELAYRFGEYGQTNTLKWEEDDHVTAGYGDGTIPVAHEVLPATYELAKLPFAASEASPQVLGLLRILNFEAQDLSATPPTYNKVEAKPRLTLRATGPDISGHLINTPASDGVAQVLTPFATTASFFAGDVLSLELNATVLTTYWADLKALLDQSRYLTEYYRLTPQDVAELDFSIPIYDGLLGDYFAVSQVSEYNARRPVEVKLVRLNAAHLPAPRVPGAGQEFYQEEFFNVEFY